MSIILKGIDMPEKGKAWSMDIYDDGQVVLFYACHIEGRDKIQAIQIPTPHGRLIDEDEIYEQPHCGECNDATLDAINNAPTILEAEE